MTTPYDTYKNAILGVPFDPNKQPSRQGAVKAFAEMQLQLEGAQAGALVKDTLTNLEALTSVSEASIMAWVIGDTTQANNGIYENTGTDVAPSWTRRSDIPQFVISAINEGDGTANAIQVTTDLAIPVENARCLILLPVVADNTNSVSVSFNGGSLKSIKTISGANVGDGELLNGMVVTGYISDNEFRLVTDIASASIVAQAEAARDAALNVVHYSYQTRNQATADVIALLPNGTIVDVAGLEYQRDDIVSLADSAFHDFNVAGVKPASNDSVKLSHYGNSTNAFALAAKHCVLNNQILEVESGVYTNVDLVDPPTGSLTIVGSGRDNVTIQGDGTSDFLHVNGDTKITGVRITGFTNAFNFVGAGGFSLRDSKVDTCEYLITGNIDAEVFDLSDNILTGFSKGMILESSTTITGASYVQRNQISDVARYVYRLDHEAPLYFDDNVITDIHNDGFTGTSAVARIVMRGSDTMNYIRGNTIKDVVSTDADCVLLYWSGGSTTITGNTFGRFASDDDCYLVKEKSTSCQNLLVEGNTFLGGSDAATWDGVTYLLTDVQTTNSIRRICGNIFQKLSGVCVRLFGQNAGAIPGATFVTDNVIYEMDGPCFVGAINGCEGLTVRGNRCFSHVNARHQALTGSQRQKTIFTQYSTASYGVASGVVIADNDWVFETSGEVSGPYSSGMVAYVGLSAAPPDAADIRLLNNAEKGADSYVECGGSAGTATVYGSGNIARGGLVDGPKGGTTTAKALVSLQGFGNYDETSLAYTPDDQQSAIADLGAAPTASDFNTVLAALRANGIIAE